MRKIAVVADNLALTRMKKGYSLRKLSKIAQVDYSTINKLENGKQKTTPETAKKICDALGVTFEDMFVVEN